MSNQPSFEILFSPSSKDVFESTNLTPEGRRAIEERVREVRSSESRTAPPTSTPWSSEVFELVDEIAKGSKSVTDAQIEGLPDDLTDEEIFEIVVTAAIAADRRRMKIGLSLVANPSVVPRFNAA